MCIAVTDESGQLIAFERMDGKTTSTLIAQDKAFTAAGAAHDRVLRRGQPAWKADLWYQHRYRRPFVDCRGRIPVLVDGQVVGAVGVSSGTPAQDSECAAAAIEHFSNRWPERAPSACVNYPRLSMG